MKSNTSKIIIVVLLLVAVLFLRLYKYQAHDIRPAYSSASQHPRSEPDAGSGSHQSIINPDVPLIYTRHVRCRMDCRHISEQDIREVLRDGHINEAKSEAGSGPCPTYAIEEDRHSDGVRLRIVFAKCDHETKVVTCIDRDHEYECDCK